MAEYYVVRDKNTGLYFRGKGVNRWGKYYNQASIYRIKANAENTIKEVSWRGEQAEIMPIQIVETTEDVAPKSEVAREIFEEIGEILYKHTNDAIKLNSVTCELMIDCIGEDIAELKKKYTDNSPADPKAAFVKMLVDNWKWGEEP